MRIYWIRMFWFVAFLCSLCIVLNPLGWPWWAFASIGGVAGWFWPWKVCMFVGREQ